MFNQIKAKHLKPLLELQPVAAAMVIPGCHSGINRGGDGGVCSQKEDDGDCLRMRGGCGDNKLMQKYKQMDVILSDDDNKCTVFIPENEYKQLMHTKFTHQAVIVGMGWMEDGTRYNVVKQSWGSQYGNQGYQKIMMTESPWNSPFCL